MRIWSPIGLGGLGQNARPDHLKPSNVGIFNQREIHASMHLLNKGEGGAAGHGVVIFMANLKAKPLAIFVSSVRRLRKTSLDFGWLRYKQGFFAGICRT